MKLVILDRDGVINADSPAYIKSPDEWHAIPGSLEAIARLNKAGYKVAIATNQSGVGRGYYDLNTLEKIHEKMFAEMKKVGAHVDALFFCPHTPDDHCDCRKPKPGLLLKIGQALNIDLKKSLMIGDSSRDLEAAKAAGASGLFIGESGFPDLKTAVDALLSLKPSFPKKNELLAKACGIKKGFLPSIIDISAGLGTDAYFLQNLGCDVVLVERNPVMALLLSENFKHIYNSDARDYLKNISELPDVIYFDPIFPEKTKTALSQKKVRYLRQIVGKDEDAADVFLLALKRAKKRVVVKRPRYAETINEQKPDIVFKGKSVRFDVYLKH